MSLGTTILFVTFFIRCSPFRLSDEENNPVLTGDELELIKNQIECNQTDDALQFSAEQKRAMRQRAGVVGVKHWPNGVMVYSLDSNLNNDQRRMIKTAINEYKKYTCINFREKTAKDTDYVAFTNQQGCWSSIGMTGGRQDLSLGLGCYYEPVTAMHEMAHALGFMHEQTRPDRDSWIDILDTNIQDKMKYNFDRFNQGLVTDLPYDYKSIMHYDKMAFSKNGQITMRTHFPQFQDVIGQNVGFSTCDVAKINSLYNCNKDKYVTTCRLNRNYLAPFELAK
uniref:Metalloendopeptidase n=1 Tax=Romanomermis culicivorax TaxID=13658 RepID=A0A915JB30_ROMCU